MVSLNALSPIAADTQRVAAVVSPRTVKQHLRTLFLRAGIRDALRMILEYEGYQVLTSNGDLRCRCVVLAGGGFSA